MLQALVKGHAIGEKYDPKYLGAGSEQIVYSIPDHLGIVAKVAYLTFQKSIDWNIAHGQPADSLTPELKGAMDADIHAERLRFERMREYFGYDHVLPQRRYVIKLPTSPKLLAAVYGRAGAKPPEGVREAAAVLTIQKRSEGLQDPKSLTLVYRDGLQHPTARALLDAAGADEGLKKALKDFCVRCIRYTNQTGEIIDMGMPDNVVFYHRTGKWAYEIVDGLYPQTKNAIESMRKNRAKNEAGIQLTEDGAKDMQNGSDYVQTMNSFAERLNLPDRVAIAPIIGERAEAIQTNILNFRESDEWRGLPEKQRSLQTVLSGESELNTQKVYSLASSHLQDLMLSPDDPRSTGDKLHAQYDTGVNIAELSKQKPLERYKFYLSLDLGTPKKQADAKTFSREFIQRCQKQHLSITSKSFKHDYDSWNIYTWHPKEVQAVLRNLYKEYEPKGIFLKTHHWLQGPIEGILPEHIGWVQEPPGTIPGPSHSIRLGLLGAEMDKGKSYEEACTRVGVRPDAPWIFSDNHAEATAKLIEEYGNE